MLEGKPCQFLRLLTPRLSDSLPTVDGVVGRLVQHDHHKQVAATEMARAVSQVLAANICQGQKGALGWPRWGGKGPQDEEDKGEEQTAGAAKSQDRRKCYGWGEGEKLCTAKERRREEGAGSLWQPFFIARKRSS